MEQRVEQVTVSAIIPVGARYGDITVLYPQYRAGLEALGVPYEVIFVLDGPRREFAEALARLEAGGESFSVLRLAKPFGEATALTAGFERARGEIIVTLPAYEQIDPSEIVKLVQSLSAADVAVGRRWPRAGGRLESWRRSAFHGAVSWLTGMRFRDIGCSARAMQRRVLEEISLYGDQHRFLALLADRQGFKVVEVDVHQSTQDRFRGRYRMREYAHRALDLITVLFLVRFTKKPLRFFGMLGVITAGLGALLLLYLTVERLFLAEPLADRPALLLSSLLAVVGLQLFAIGLLGELIIFTHARDIKDYKIDEVIRFSRDAQPQEESPLEARPVDGAVAQDPSGRKQAVSG
jgi:glycosyltransferase involved in cell wall biosynthesis